MIITIGVMGLIKLKKNNKGAMSIISIILVIMLALVASGFLTILERIIIKNEVQGVMDTSGLIALRQGVDSDVWRQEEKIEIDETVAKDTYRELLSKNIQTGGNIVSFEIRDLKIHAPNAPGLSSLGISGRDRDQYFLESTVVLHIKSSSEFGLPAETSWEFYNFLNRTSEDKTTSIKASTSNPGESILILRSVTRLVMR